MLTHALQAVLQRLHNAARDAGRPTPALLAVGKLQPAAAVAALAATLFDWVQTVDRAKLIPLLAAARPADRPSLNVLIQVNVDDESSKHGCRPEDAAALADAVAGHPTLRLRGLMAIPAPLPDLERRRDAFRRMKVLFDAIAARHPSMDTLSMGMSDDFELAIAEGATVVRVGTALFGARPARR